MSKNVYNTRGVNNTINQASDVAISNLQDGQELVWDAAANKWVNQTVVYGKENLSELLDVNLVEPSDPQLLKYDNGSGKWVNGRAAISEMSDAVISTPLNNQILRYNSGLSVWQNSNETANVVSSVFTRTGAVTAQSGDYSLSQISGVSLAGPTTNQVLKYNGANFTNTFLADTTYNFVPVDAATVTAAYDTIYRVNAGTINMIPAQQDRVIKIIVIQGTLLTLNFPSLLVYINNVGYFDESFQVNEACYIELNFYAGTAWIVTKISSRITRVSTGQIISYSTPALSGLLDTNITTPLSNDFLKYNGSQWINSSAPVTSVFGRTGAVAATEGDYSLTQLSDVTITAPSTGNVALYNGSAWVNSFVDDTTRAFTNVTGSITGVAGNVYYMNGSAVIAAPTPQVGQTIKFINEESATSRVTFTGVILVHIGSYLNANLQVTDAAYMEINYYASGTWIISKLSGRWTNLTNGEVFTYSKAQINDLRNVSISAPANGNSLIYNGSNWVNQTLSRCLPTAELVQNGAYSLTLTTQNTWYDIVIPSSIITNNSNVFTNPSAGVLQYISAVTTKYSHTAISFSARSGTANSTIEVGIKQNSTLNTQSVYPQKYGNSTDDQIFSIHKIIVWQPNDTIVMQMRSTSHASVVVTFSQFNLVAMCCCAQDQN